MFLVCWLHILLFLYLCAVGVLLKTHFQKRFFHLQVKQNKSHTVCIINMGTDSEVPPHPECFHRFCSDFTAAVQLKDLFSTPVLVYSCPNKRNLNLAFLIQGEKLKKKQPNNTIVQFQIEATPSTVNGFSFAEPCSCPQKERSGMRTTQIGRTDRENRQRE